MPSIAPLDINASTLGHVEWAGFVDDVPAFASVSGEVHLVAGKCNTVSAHAGLLAACATRGATHLVTSGEDGKVNRINADGQVTQLAEKPGKWIDRLAAGPDGVVAYASGKHAWVVAGSGEREIAAERSIEGLAFAPKGMRLALARYNGVDLFWANTPSGPQFLEWKGAHTGVTFSPDGKYVVTTMQENALHGWRISDGRHMRMTGYPAKVHSLSWSLKGRWLASSGAPAAIVWPFSGKDGPMGKAPKELGAIGAVLVTRVACHPSEDVVAIGYESGLVMAVRIEDGKEAVLRREGGGEVSALSWDASGKRLAYGTSGGEAGIVDLG